MYDLQLHGIKLGLKNITKLLSLLGDPHKRLSCIHIAGSNGKGSTAAFLHAVYTHSGYRAGLYTSPHLSDFRERIRIGNEYITQDAVVGLADEIRLLCRTHDLGAITFFEFVTAMAFSYFAQAGAEPVIVETGLGGRFDATNVINPMLSIITTIDYDHMQYLGGTLEEIAREKAGIIKPATPLITAAAQPAIQHMLKEACISCSSRFFLSGESFICHNRDDISFDYISDRWTIQGVQSPLPGDYQKQNATLAIAAAELLSCDTRFSVNADQVKAGIASTVWPGRFETIRDHPLIIVDGAHNPAAWAVLRDALLSRTKGKKLYFIFGIMKDKQIERMIDIYMPIASGCFFCPPAMKRAALQSDIMSRVKFSLQEQILWYDSTSSAVLHALDTCCKDDCICVTGSLFVVAEARAFLLDGCTDTRPIGM